MANARPLHWAGRFFSSIRPGGPPAADLAWADGLLSDRERSLFLRMSSADRRHAIDVARRVDATLGDEALGHEVARRDEVLVAALLHDIGKTAAGLSTYGRVVATLCRYAGGAAVAELWQDTRGFTRRVGLYIRYPILGAEMLQVADSAPWVVAWSREHHLDEEEWTVPPAIGRVLVAADR